MKTLKLVIILRLLNIAVAAVAVIIYAKVALSVFGEVGFVLYIMAFAAFALLFIANTAELIAKEKSMQFVRILGWIVLGISAIFLREARAWALVGIVIALTAGEIAATNYLANHPDPPTT